MVKRRPDHDPLQTSAEPRWLKVLDAWRNERSSLRIEPGADLRSLLRHEAARWTAQGWEVESGADGARHGFFFVRRAGERLLVQLTPRETPVGEPRVALPGPPPGG